jgi:hypothetical protein
LNASDLPDETVQFLVNWNGAVDSNGNLLAEEFIPPSQPWVAPSVTVLATRTYSTAGTKTVNFMAQDTSGNMTPWQSVTFTCTDQPADQTTGTTNNTGATGSGTPVQTDLNLIVTPTLIRSGNGANVSWSSTNMTSCVVTSDDNDHWPADSSDAALQSPIGGETSNPITVLTTFTLTCMGADGVSKSQQVQVDIIPVLQEI